MYSKIPSALILPVGTQIVTRAELPATADRDAVPAGAVGVIVKAPFDQTHAEEDGGFGGRASCTPRGGRDTRPPNQVEACHAPDPAIAVGHHRPSRRVRAGGDRRHRERLLAIRDGATGWDKVNAWRLELHREFDAAFAATKLPEQPDYQRVNEYLIRARRSMV